MLVQTSGDLCRTDLFDYRPLVDVLLNNCGNEKHVCAWWTLAVFERDVLMHASKVDTSAASLFVSHSPLGTLSHCPLDSDGDLHLSWGSGGVMLSDMCLLLLGFSWVMQRIWSLPVTTAAAPRQPGRDYDCSRRWYTCLLTELAPSTHTHTCHTVSAGRHVRPQTDWTKVLLVPSLYLLSIFSDHGGYNGAYKD